MGACDGIALEDICPNDPGKTVHMWLAISPRVLPHLLTGPVTSPWNDWQRPGLCGCGDAETDGDGDGVSSCSGPMEFDACPDDSAKIVRPLRTYS